MLSINEIKYELRKFALNKEMYCICYNNNNDRRILLNYGLFYLESECKDFILNKNLGNDFTPFPIKVNNNDVKKCYIEMFMNSIIEYFIETEFLAYHYVKQEGTDAVIMRHGVSESTLDTLLLY